MTRPRLLLVDDEPVNIRVLREIFREECDLLMATSGQQAIEVCTGERPDLVLLDIMMLGMDGLETCRRLLQEPMFESLPIIFVTGQTSAEEETAALEAGGVDFITKPVNPSVVRARVRTQLLLSEQRRQLHELAFTDGLTGVANRRRFDERLDREWRAARRSGHPLGLILLDIDHFKAYNDAHGHLLGDETLRWVAQTLQSALRRPLDLLARYGGEEFACIIPDADADAALRTAEHLRNAVMRGERPHEASTTSPFVTVSLGAAAMVPDPEGAGALLDAADKALYAAKLCGRNAAVAAGGD